MTLEQEKKISSQVTSKYHKEGVYYTGFCKQYHSITEKELTVQDDLVKDLVSTYEKVSSKYLYLELKHIEYPFMGRDEVYYIRNFGQYLGKVAVSVQSLGNSHYDLTVIYYYKRTKQYRDMKLKPVKKYGEDNRISKNRYASRRAHRTMRNNKTTRGTKSL